MSLPVEGIRSFFKEIKRSFSFSKVHGDFSFFFVELIFNCSLSPITFSFSIVDDGVLTFNLGIDRRLTDFVIFTAEIISVSKGDGFNRKLTSRPVQTVGVRAVSVRSL